MTSEHRHGAICTTPTTPSGFARRTAAPGHHDAAGVRGIGAVEPADLPVVLQALPARRLGRTDPVRAPVRDRPVDRVAPAHGRAGGGLCRRRADPRHPDGGLHRPAGQGRKLVPHHLPLPLRHELRGHRTDLAVAVQSVHGPAERGPATGLDILHIQLDRATGHGALRHRSGDGLAGQRHHDGHPAGSTARCG